MQLSHQTRRRNVTPRVPSPYILGSGGQRSGSRGTKKSVSVFRRNAVLTLGFPRDRCCTCRPPVFSARGVLASGRNTTGGHGSRLSRECWLLVLLWHSTERNVRREMFGDQPSFRVNRSGSKLLTHDSTDLDVLTPWPNNPIRPGDWAFEKSNTDEFQTTCNNRPTVGLYSTTN